MSKPLGALHLAFWSLAGFGCAPQRQGLGLDADGSGAASAEPDNEATDAGELVEAECRVTRRVELPLEPPDQSGTPPGIELFGERFALVFGDAAGQDRVADVTVVSWQGVAFEDHFVLTGLCPDDRCRNLHGSAVLATSDGRSEFLLAEQGSSVSMPEYPLRLLAWRAESAEAAVAPLFESRVNAITTRSDMKASRNASRALFASGNTDRSPLRLIELAEGAAVIGAAMSLEPTSIPWDCLEIVPTEEAGAVSVISRPDAGPDMVWTLRELDAAGNTVLEAHALVPVLDELGYADCPRVIESAQGFHAQWVNDQRSSVVATIARGANPGAPPALVNLSVSPGKLVGVLGDDLLFQSTLDDGRQGFVRLSRNGEVGSALSELPLRSELGIEPALGLPRLLRTAERSLQISYELENALMFEELQCP